MDKNLPGSSVETSDENSQPNKSKRHLVFLVGIAFILFLVGVGGYFLGMKKTSQSTNTPSVTKVYNQSGQPLQHVILQQGDKTQIVIPQTHEQKNIDFTNLATKLPDGSFKCELKDASVFDEFLNQYVVKKGDTLLSIAKNQLNDTSRVQELIELSYSRYPSLSLNNPFIEVGWKLYLPPKFLNVSHSGKLALVKGEILEDREKYFRVQIHPAINAGAGLYEKNKHIVYLGKESFTVGDCVSILVDIAGVNYVLAISPQDKDYFRKWPDL